MKRNAISDLINWKNSADRKPLVMRGARQVGKTWLMREFGQSCYSGFVYFNFDEEDELKSIFETNKNPQRIVELLSLIAGPPAFLCPFEYKTTWIKKRNKMSVLDEANYRNPDRKSVV